MRSKKQILVVDEKDVADTLAILLRIKGFETAVAYSGSEAISHLKAHPIDAALIAICLYDISGAKFAEIIKTAMMSPPLLIAQSCHQQAADRMTRFNEGFAAHLVKPGDTDILVNLLNNLLWPALNGVL
ncbi:MAG: putative two component transcriptional regulator, sensor histidine kinase [Verrucomicrobiaceae bacterium]|nr:putative two component transcriptional regulator, sensor histidine kinase [Verrucomicrobiaceae bacterium]